MPSPVPVEWRGLGARIASAAVLAPPALAALYFGSPYSDILILIVAALAAWEWARICRGPRLGPAGWLAVLAVLAGTAAGALGRYDVAGWVIALGAMAALSSAGWERGAAPGARAGPGAAAWLSVGVGYLGAACLALLWLRADPVQGRWIVFWLVIAVWGTDIGGYFVGRAVGGPRLAPRISPGKTWSGLLGGMAFAGLLGAAAAALAGEDALRWGGLGVALAVVAQLGDLFESGLKRRFGVKDSSRLIPGHGGLLDRIDGALAGAIVIGAGQWLTGAIH